MKDKASRFRQLHLTGETFIMANAWNPGSAVLLEEAGFEAIGTTSAGVAYSHALPDYEGALSFDAALNDTAAIVNSVGVPVSMDAENGYGDSPQEVFSNMQRIAATGVVGANIEDYSGDKNKPLYDIDLGVERIAAARQAVNELDRNFTLTARAECYLCNHPDPFAESIKRLNHYRQAGADCLFVPGIKDIETIRQLVKEVDGPLNVVMGLAGKPISLAQLNEAGVARISIGGSLARATFGLIRRAAKEMLEKGTFDYSAQQIPDAELCQLFSNRLQDT